MENFINQYSKIKKTESTVKPNVFTFGRYKGKSYDEVYQTDKPYIAYVMKSDPKYFKRVQDYLRPIIINDFKD